MDKSEDDNNIKSSMCRCYSSHSIPSTMYSAKSILLCAAIIYLPLRISSLAFDRAIHHTRRSRQAFPLETTSSTTKCPFSSMTKWLKLPSESNESSSDSRFVSVQYADVPHTGAVPMTEDLILSSQSAMSTTLTNRYRIHMEKSYRNALALRCPFFRRRATDVLEFTDSTMRQLLGRNVVSSLGPAIALRGVENGGKKLVGLSLEELTEIIRNDWREGTSKGYYITGRLTANVYRDDCLFDGPDPDMPVRGLRKYMNAASQLFEYKSSTSELLSLQIHEGAAVAKWRFNGTMRLPWKPKLPEVTGTTTYHIDSSGLIYKHIETWDISTFQAFVQTFLPKLSKKIWPTAPIEIKLPDNR